MEHRTSGSPGKDGRHLDHLPTVHTFQHLAQHRDLHTENLPGPTYLLIVLLRTEEDLQCQVTDVDESNPNIYY